MTPKSRAPYCVTLMADRLLVCVHSLLDAVYAAPGYGRLRVHRNVAFPLGGRLTTKHHRMALALLSLARAEHPLLVGISRIRQLAGRLDRVAGLIKTQRGVGHWVPYELVWAPPPSLRGTTAFSERLDWVLQEDRGPLVGLSGIRPGMCLMPRCRLAVGTGLDLAGWRRLFVWLRLGVVVVVWILSPGWEF
eukprot:IDg3206t1